MPDLPAPPGFGHLASARGSSRRRPGLRSGGVGRPARHELLVDHERPRPVGEHRLDDRPHLLPRQPAVADADPGDGDARDALGVRLLPHRPEGRLDRLVAGPRPPVALLGAQVEHPGPVLRLPEPAVAQVEPPGLGLAPAAVLLVHLGVASPEGPWRPPPPSTPGSCSRGRTPGRRGRCRTGQAVGGDLPEEDAAEPLLHRPLGLEGDRLGVVVADHHRAVGRDQPGVLGLVVPAAGPALLLLELVEVAVVALRDAGLGRALRGGVRLGTANPRP